MAEEHFYSGHDRYIEYLLVLRDQAEKNRWKINKDVYAAIDFYFNLPCWYCWKWLGGRTRSKLEDYTYYPLI